MRELEGIGSGVTGVGQANALGPAKLSEPPTFMDNTRERLMQQNSRLSLLISDMELFRIRYEGSEQPEDAPCGVGCTQHGVRGVDLELDTFASQVDQLATHIGYLKTIA